MKTSSRYLTFLLILAICGASLLTVSSVHAQQAIVIASRNVEYLFGGQVTFWAALDTDTPPAKVQIFLKSVNDTDTLVGNVSIRGNELVYTHDLIQHPLQAFSRIEYWYAIQMAGEDPYISPKFDFFYEDNRFSWRTLEAPPFEVHWYEGDPQYGQMVLDIAQASLENAQRLLELPTPDLVDIFVYANGAEMQSTLSLGGLTMVEGHANPKLGVMFISVPPGLTQQLELESQVPHELMHILLYRKTLQNYSDLPTWLLEGLASLNESFPDPDYQSVLLRATKDGALIPMASLCRGFPLEASKFYQSYAQTDSFTRFLYQKYGTEGILGLIEAYAGGLDCERGAEIVLGKTLTQIDLEWQKQEFQQSPAVKALEAVFPYLAMLLLILVAPILLILNSLLRVKADGKKVREGSIASGG